MVLSSPRRAAGHPHQQIERHQDARLVLARCRALGRYIQCLDAALDRYSNDARRTDAPRTSRRHCAGCMILPVRSSSSTRRRAGRSLVRPSRRYGDTAAGRSLMRISRTKFPKITFQKNYKPNSGAYRWDALERRCSSIEMDIPITRRGSIVAAVRIPPISGIFCGNPLISPLN